MVDVDDISRIDGQFVLIHILIHILIHLIISLIQFPIHFLVHFLSSPSFVCFIVDIDDISWIDGQFVLLIGRVVKLRD